MILLPSQNPGVVLLSDYPTPATAVSSLTNTPTVITHE